MTRLYCFGKQCTNVYIADGPNVNDRFSNENVSKLMTKGAATR